MSRTIKGVLGSKLGMTQIWDDNNRVIPVTVIQVGPCKKKDKKKKKKREN